MPHPVTQFQIVTRTPDEVASFLGDLFGWQIDDNNALRYRTIDTGSERGIPGGIWPAPPEAPTFVQLFVEVEDLQGAVKKAQDLGSTVLVPPQKLPDGDAMAVVRTPHDLPLALYRPAAA